MSNRSRQKHAPRAPDILGKSQNWVQMVSSLRVSNIRVGQHITSLLGDKEKPPGFVNGSVFVTTFVKLSRYRSDAVIISGGISGLRLFKTYFSSSSVDFITELIFEFLDMQCLDGCFFGSSDSMAAFLLKSFDDKDPHFFIRTVDITNPSHFNERKFSGNVHSITSSNTYLFIGLTSGVLRVFDPVRLEPVADIPSLPGRRVIYTTSPRWIAVETPASDTQAGGAVDRTSLSTRMGTGTDAVGDTARQMVTGLYSISKVSWNVVSPLIRRAYTAATTTALQEAQRAALVSEKAMDSSVSDITGSGDGVSDSGTSLHAPSTSSSTPAVVGGSVLVLDVGGSSSGSSYAHSPITDASTLPIISHFSAHATSLSSLAFSPNGLLLASADINGQVILVHSLVPSGLLGPAHDIIKPESVQQQQQTGPMSAPKTPQLLYKLVRGLSLANIVDLGFDDRQSVIYASSLNGTVHVFDLWQTAAADSVSTNGGEYGGRSQASSWSQHSSKPNSYTDGSPALDIAMMSGGGGGGFMSCSNGTASHSQWAGGLSSSHENSQFPVTNVSLFLQMTRPNMRVLQGYSDQRVKLPMRDMRLVPVAATPGHRSSQGAVPDSQSTSGEGVDVSDGNGAFSMGTSALHGNTSLFSEVNIHSKCIIFSSSDIVEVSLSTGNGHNGPSAGASPSYEPNGGGGSNSCGSFEVFAGTSEGLLSRFRVVTKSAATGSSTPQQPIVKELNRWDLCATLSLNSGGGTVGGGNGYGTTHSDKGGGSAADDPVCDTGTDRAVPVPPPRGITKEGSGYGPSASSAASLSSLSTYLTLAGHAAVYAVDPPPLWMRPQIVFRQYDMSNAACPDSSAVNGCDEDGDGDRVMSSTIEENHCEQVHDTTTTPAISDSLPLGKAHGLKKTKKMSDRSSSSTDFSSSNKGKPGALALDLQEANGNARSTGSDKNTTWSRAAVSVSYASASEAVRVYFPERIATTPLAGAIASYMYVKDSGEYVSAHSRGVSPAIPIYPSSTSSSSRGGTAGAVIKSQIDPRVLSAVNASLLHSAGGTAESVGVLANGKPSRGVARGIAITRRARTPENLSAWEIDEDWTGDELAARIIAVDDDYNDEMFLHDSLDDGSK